MFTAGLRKPVAEGQKEAAGLDEEVAGVIRILAAAAQQNLEIVVNIKKSTYVDFTQSDLADQVDACFRVVADGSVGIFFVEVKNQPVFSPVAQRRGRGEV